MKDETKADKLVLFRQSATSMSVGVLFITISLNPTMSYMGFFLACISVLLLLAAGLQTMQKASKFCESMRILGEKPSFIFILASLLPIVLNWASILNASAMVKTTPTPNFIQHFFESEPPIFVMIFGIIFVLVLLSDVKAIKRKIGNRETLITFLLVSILLGGLYVVSSVPFSYSIALVPKVILLVIWGLLTLGCLYYLSNQKIRRDKQKEIQSSVENPDIIDLI